MAAPKLDSILNNVHATVSNVDIRRESEWVLPTLEHAEARPQWLTADALQAMNLIDQPSTSMRRNSPRTRVTLTLRNP
jgi:hypothetical protein